LESGRGTKNRNGRVVAVGDVHGCSTALAALVEAVRPGPEDLLIALGDVIDYGPDSRGVLRQLRELRDRTRLVLLRGNHEEMLLGVLDRRADPESWTRHGGDRTLQSYGVDGPGDLPAEDVEFLRSALPFFETPTHAFVHAGYFPNQPLSDTPSSALFWEFLDPGRAWPHFSGKTFVVGHTPQSSGEILDLGFLVCVDTDASRGKWLTALDATSGRFWQADQGGKLREGNRRCH
jgi:serine/threonine protein phosphatase 1